jgi:hypothetical protein
MHPQLRRIDPEGCRRKEATDLTLRIIATSLIRFIGCDSCVFLATIQRIETLLQCIEPSGLIPGRDRMPAVELCLASSGKGIFYRRAYPHVMAKFVSQFVSRTGNRVELNALAL